MKITNREIDKMYAKPEVMETVKQKDFKPKTSYWLATALGELDPKAELFGAERQKIIGKYVTRDDKGKIIQLADNQISITNVSKFNSEMKELLDIEINLSMDKIKFNLEKEPACTIEEMVILLPLIEVV